MSSIEWTPFERKSMYPSLRNHPTRPETEIFSGKPLLIRPVTDFNKTNTGAKKILISSIQCTPFELKSMHASLRNQPTKPRTALSSRKTCYDSASDRFHQT